jgi:hypothetical protein
MKLASDVNTMGGGLSLPVLSVDPGVLIEFPTLPGSVFTTGKSPSGAKKLFLTTGCGFW